MHIYKTSPKYKIFVWAVIALFYLFAISFLVYEVLGGIKNYPAFFVLIFLVMLVPVFLTIAALVQFSAYFAFYDSYFEYHKWRKTIRIEGRNLRYFSYSEGLFTVYFVKDDEQDEKSSFEEIPVSENSAEREFALPEDKEMYKFSIGIAGIKDADKILNWFYENVPCVPSGQEAKDAVSISSKYSTTSQNDVNLILAKARKIATFINWISAIFAVWCAFFPHPYRLCIELNLIVPIALLFVLHFSNGWIRFDKKGNSVYPTACLAGICPMFGLGLRLIDDYIFENSAGRFFVASAIFYAVYMILFLICQKEFSFKEKYSWFALLAYSVFFFGYSMCAVAAINCMFDFSAPVEEIVKDNGEMITVLLHKGLLGIKWY